MLDCNEYSGSHDQSHLISGDRGSGNRGRGDRGRGDSIEAVGIEAVGIEPPTYRYCVVIEQC